MSKHWETKEEAYPLNISNWEFYVIPTKIINELCGNNKTISLDRVRIITEKINYQNIKKYIDTLIDKNEI